MAVKKMVFEWIPPYKHWKEGSWRLVQGNLELIHSRCIKGCLHHLHRSSIWNKTAIDWNTSKQLVSCLFSEFWKVHYHLVAKSLRRNLVKCNEHANHSFSNKEMLERSKQRMSHPRTTQIWYPTTFLFQHNKKTLRRRFSIRD